MSLSCLYLSRRLICGGERRLSALQDEHHVGISEFPQHNVVPPEHVPSLLSLTANSVCLGYAYPALASAKTAVQQDPAAFTQWMTYWYVGGTSEHGVIVYILLQGPIEITWIR